MPLKQLKITKQITLREGEAIDKYLQQIHSIPRLKVEEEIACTQEIKKGFAFEEELKARKKEYHLLVRQHKNKPSASLAAKVKRADKALLKLRKKGIEIRKNAKEAKEKLVLGNLRFVISVVKKYQNRKLPMNDLINEGNIGLIKAAERFDETRGFKFISYAVWWIRQHILQALEEQSKGRVRLPMNKVGERLKIFRVIPKLTKKLQRPPTYYEIAEELGISVEAVIFTQEVSVKPLSIDAPFKQGEESTLADVVPNEEALAPEQTLERSSQHEILATAIEKLTPRAQAVIKDWYGFGRKNSATKSLEDIATDMKLTPERARQIKEEAIRDLRLILKENHTYEGLYPV